MSVLFGLPGGGGNHQKNSGVVKHLNPTDANALNIGMCTSISCWFSVYHSRNIILGIERQSSDASEKRGRNKVVERPKKKLVSIRGRCAN